MHVSIMCGTYEHQLNAHDRRKATSSVANNFSSRSDGRSRLEDSPEAEYDNGESTTEELGHIARDCSASDLRGNKMKVISLAHARVTISVRNSQRRSFR